MRKASSATRMTASKGLMVHDHALGRKALVMTSQEIYDDVLGTLPKLQTAVEQASTKIERPWKQQRAKNDVEFYELVPEGGSDPDVAHALLAKAELHCHVNEVLSVLVHRDSEDLDATVQSVGGSKIRGGGIYYQQLQPLKTAVVKDVETQPESALFTVQSVVVRPKFNIKRRSNLRIGTSTSTIRFPSRDRAIHLMKTLPKHVHSKMVTENEGVALDGTLDHLAVGWDIQLINDGKYGSGNHTTRVVALSYISTVPPTEYGRLHPASFDSSVLAQHRQSYYNSDAEYIIDVVTKSLREFETVIRRRRLGFQSFIAHPKDEDANTPTCTICRKKFSFFRRDHFCHLCGHVVCGECSGTYDVEAPVGRVNKTRCCIACIRRVDACHFDDEDLVPSLGPLVVDTSEDDWTSGVVSLTDSLLSNEPDETSKALESLEQIIRQGSFHARSSEAEVSQPRTPSTTTSPTSATKPTKKDIIRDLNHLLTKHLTVVKDSHSVDNCPVYNTERDYALEFDADMTTHPDIPLAPQPNSEKEARRLSLMETSGVLDEDYDRSALDLLAQVAAKRLGCPIGFIGMVDGKSFHAIGNYQLEVSEEAIPRNENLCMHTIYAERPLIHKNLQRDMRYAQMPVVRDSGIKFYAGFPVRAPDGTVLATLCTIDVEPHDNIGTKDYATMEMLSELAAELIVPKEQQS
ncbi:hypothetical protein Poli38472_013642 [Pythium oligandrum]|uniref:FYVE-type domain-containing protein n=1 Tax=Pythium oligandrum TaxID=41045 RepID=A0A8K1CD32_PYTOL|nr:hypothetical protein Poli38472_013642 [Pythium oligandrum]|eukprot:TMW61179.1 hypothetical protein Poli38472_013642 [Pythium oligandrum]